MDDKKSKKSSEVQSALVHKTGKLLTIARFLLFISVFGGLVGFLPFAFISGVFFKAGVIYIGLISAFVLVVISSLKSNEILLPNNMFQYVLPVLPIAYLISAIFSPVWGVSAVGYGFETGTLSFMVTMTLLVYLVTMLLRKKKYISLFQLLILATSVLLFIVQFAAIFAPELLGLSKVLNSPISNFIGNLNDLGVFFGAVLMLSVIIIELAPWGKTSKIIAYITGVMSLLVLVLASFTNLWILIGIFSLCIFASRFVASGQSGSNNQKKFSNVSFGVVIISAIFILFGANISGEVYSQIGISGTDLYPPTISQTLPVISESFKDNALLGVGPNRFSSEWVKHKPSEINQGLLWGVNYNYGNSHLLTSIVTTGLLGVIAWISVFGLLLYTGFRHVFKGGKKGGDFEYLSFSSFILATYFWFTMLIHVPSSGLLTLTFMSTGIFIASLYAIGLYKTKVYKFDSKPSTSLVVVIVMSLLILGGIAFDFLVASKVFASVTYQKALQELNGGNFDEAKKYMEKSVSFGGNDIYHRGLSNIYLRELQTRASELTNDPTENQILISRNLAANASESAQRARLADQTNYENYMSIGTVLQLFVSPQNDTTYNTAKASFEKALELNPKNPSIFLALANLEIVKGNQDIAVEYLAKSLGIKPNYSQARFMWAQLQVSQGDIKSAVDTLEDAATISPFDAGVQFQLGLLRFESENFTNAAVSFDRVLQLIPSHANARYYLALSLAELDRADEAITLLETILQTNKDNDLLKQTIESLKNSDPDPVGSIEELDDLPIDELDDVPEDEEEN